MSEAQMTPHPDAGPALENRSTDWGWADDAPRHTLRYLVPVVNRVAGFGPGMRVLDVGCGNGFYSAIIAETGAEVVGVDISEEGIDIARRARPGIRFEAMPIHRGMCERLGVKPFDVVVSTEVIEHLYDPSEWVESCFNATAPGGRIVCSTPYHGYLKNLALSLFNKWDAHWHPAMTGGHIKFWSRATLGGLLASAGYRDVRFAGAGRAPLLWMSMVLEARRPRE